MIRGSKSQDVQPISLINLHKFDLYKPYNDEEDLYPKEELLQKENKSENLHSMNKTISSISVILISTSHIMRRSCILLIHCKQCWSLCYYYKVRVIFKIQCDTIQSKTFFFII